MYVKLNFKTKVYLSFGANVQSMPLAERIAFQSVSTDGRHVRTEKLNFFPVSALFPEVKSDTNVCTQLELRVFLYLGVSWVSIVVAVSSSSLLFRLFCYFFKCKIMVESSSPPCGPTN